MKLHYISLLSAALLFLPLAGCATDQPTGSDGSDAAGDIEDVHRIDRLGRTDVTDILLQQHLDAYNRENTFRIVESHLAEYRPIVDRSLKVFDQMDGINNWTPDGGLHPLTEPFLHDFQIVDTSKPCTVDTPSYLEIEIATLRGSEFSTCGGRTPNDDTIDTILTLFINGPDRDEPRRSDGVDSATKPSSSTFPYLADPN